MSERNKSPLSEKQFTCKPQILVYEYGGIIKQAGTKSLNVCAGHLSQHGSLCAYLCISAKSL